MVSASASEEQVEAVAATLRNAGFEGECAASWGHRDGGLETMDESSEKPALEAELVKLRAENERLRANLGARRPQQSVETKEEDQSVRVLIIPAPDEENEYRKGPSAEPMANVAQVILGHMRDSQPEHDWRAEFDLARIPTDALCYRLGEVVRKVWDGSGPLPATFVVGEVEEEGERRLVRQVVAGEPESECFREAQDALLASISDVLREGEAAHGAGAHHHANWSLKAADVMLARQKLAWVIFRGGENGWREILAEARPEYELPV